MKMRAVGVGAAFAALVCAACTPTGPPVTSPSPGTSASSTAQPTPPETAEEQKRRLAYAAAETNYRELAAELDRLYAAGGTSRATELMKSKAAGPNLAYQTEQLRAFKALGLRTQGRVRIAAMQRRGFSDKELSLFTCEDATGVRTLKKNGDVESTGFVVTNDITVRLVGSSWRVWDVEPTEVKNCENY